MVGRGAPGQRLAALDGDMPGEVRPPGCRVRRRRHAGMQQDAPQTEAERGIHGPARGRAGDRRDALLGQALQQAELGLGAVADGRQGGGGLAPEHLHGREVHRRGDAGAPARSPRYPPGAGTDRKRRGRQPAARPGRAAGLQRGAQRAVDVVHRQERDQGPGLGREGGEGREEHGPRPLGGTERRRARRGVRGSGDEPKPLPNLTQLLRTNHLAPRMPARPSSRTASGAVTAAGEERAGAWTLRRPSC